MVTATRYTELIIDVPAEEPSLVMRPRNDEATVILDWAWIINTADSAIQRVALLLLDDLEAERAQHFAALSGWWHSEMDAVSDPNEKVEHEAYQRVIHQMGWHAVPFMLRELETLGSHWYEALEEITGGPVALPPYDRPYDLRAERDAWLAWGRSESIID
jgi:hypothetical protein